MAVDQFLNNSIALARSPKALIPALLLGACLGHASSAKALVIFDNTNNLTTANNGTSKNSGSGNNAFVPTTGSGTGSNDAVAIPLVITNSLYLNDASLQISPGGNNTTTNRNIGFYLYEATPSGTVGNSPNITQLYTPVGSYLATTSFNVLPGNTASSYSTFNFNGTNIGKYLLASGKTYLLLSGNITTTGGLGINYGSAAIEVPGTTNLITWNTTGPTGCTVSTCKTDTLTTNNGGQGFSRSQTTSTLWKINGTQAVPTPLPLLGAGLAFGYSRRLRRRTLDQQASV